jgi:hypothetical protein
VDATSLGSTSLEFQDYISNSMKSNKDLNCLFNHFALA